MEYNFINSSSIRMPRKFMETWLNFVIRDLQKNGLIKNTQLDLTVVFMGKSQAKKLNLEFRQRNYPTDVLSFEGDGKGVLGELVICPEVVKKQALEHDLTFREELGYMLLHGVLHLLGYDHEKNEAEAKVMFGIQDKVFDRLCRKFWS